MVLNNGSSDILTEDSGPEFKKLVAPQAGPRKFKLLYLNILIYTYYHISAIYGIYLCFTSAKWATIIFTYFIYVISEIGITAGSHRLYSHRAFKVKLPLEILILTMNCIAFQNTAFSWARDHRVHHKYSDTDADPHNATRGFFYSHMGWIFVRKHSEFIARRKVIPLDDLLNNPLLQFQKKYGFLLFPTLCFLMPTFVPVYFWGESISTAYNINLLRYVINLNVTFLINSAAHMYGNKPYDKNISPVQNIVVSVTTCGEGFHNYHHTFPWDYRAAELGNNTLNWTALFIDFFAWIGWAYDLKSVPQETIYKKCIKTGDGSDLWGFEKKMGKNDVCDDSTENCKDN